MADSYFGPGPLEPSRSRGSDGMCQQCLSVMDMMTSSNGNIFRVTDPLCGEFTGPGEFHTKASDAEL